MAGKSRTAISVPCVSRDEHVTDHVYLGEQ